jgi:hypothetical protein
MSRHERSSRRSVLITALAAFMVAGLPVTPVAQDVDVQQRINAIKEAAAKSKEALEQYRWQQQETITVKGKMKKQDLFQVETGPEGKPMRVAIAKDKDSSSSETQHGLKQHIAEKKSRGMEQYALEIKDLAQSYVPPDPVRLQQSYQHGDVSLAAGNVPGEIRLVIHDYRKPGDSVTFSLDQGKDLKSIDVSSYLSDPKDVVKVNAQLDRLPDGTNYVSEMMVTGASKQLTVEIKNFDYQRM